VCLCLRLCLCLCVCVCVCVCVYECVLFCGHSLRDICSMPHYHCKIDMCIHINIYTGTRNKTKKINKTRQCRHFVTIDAILCRNTLQHTATHRNALHRTVTQSVRGFTMRKFFFLSFPPYTPYLNAIVNIYVYTKNISAYLLNINGKYNTH